MGARGRYILLLAIDSLIVTFSVFLGYYILAPFFLDYTWPVLVGVSITLLISHHVFAYVFNLYHRAWEYASVREMMSITKAVTASIIVTYILTMIFFQTSFTRLMIITWMMHLLLIGGSRLSWRVTRSNIIGKEEKDRYKNKKRTMIVGAGRGGAMLVKQMLDTPQMDMIPIVAVDDEPAKQRMELAPRVRVEGDRNDIQRLIKKYEVEKVVIAIPSLSKSELNEIHSLSVAEDVEVMIMPNIDDVMSGSVKVNDLKKVQVEDLLGREPVELDTEGIEEQVRDKVILVTGAGGSIGSEIVRQITKFHPRKIVLVGHGENSIYTILEEVHSYRNSVEHIPIIADVQDKERMLEVFETYKPNIVYHAAAHKHVPLMEVNSQEAVKNNIIGTKNTAEASIKYKAEKFVLISTDKAVNPPNVMGATKKVAEMVVQALDAKTEETTLVAVRFGNVLGSRGSVIPKFRKQIENGGPITITDERMTRYFMTIPEASRLVIQAGSLANGGEVFVLDMGEPVKIIDLARNMIKFSGYRENEIDINISGIRPGEKLYEELLNENEIHPEQVYDKIYIGKAKKMININELERALSSKLYDEIIKLGKNSNV
ncbi:polysaccharide biosynthesis protein [Lacicoccus alkaliphilus]|uniref:NDP-sugar epimerase, includes UDP-GlcNAc-inverting 4,6-dehydratase FlaA1 and capsular polysaccharide biosynthesis protein EpsC n=1 Tax=Lacicoccus alkaliphilus DSM 16010 TaxID=1123231 RepID=A0A1M7FXY8_9BACL|nr:nucleoside-diphosphate sugar epimerase/dehydratase [Salinicoccus alkaliphilus]SHM08499.1 NDP-sugar epimerase, includes UDP-GlcNAc-inverting 4,6-dehydratase FlaA1 and capsular polysaccharide biosynthesis protein EpsC [Salinicoccus alkaliphilus DSM 16010]